MSAAAIAAAAAGAASSGGIAAATKGKSPKSADAPDPKVTADEQMRVNRETMAYDAATNRFQQYGPNGSVEWKNYGDENYPSWVQRTTLNPENQKLYNQQLSNQNDLASKAGQYSDQFYKSLQTTARPVNFDTFNKVAETQLARMTPGLDHKTSMLTTNLANQGLAPGSEAYTNAMRDDSAARNDAYLAAVNSAMNAQVQQEGMANANQSQNNQNQGQAINNMNSLLQGSGTVSTPQYSGSTTVSNSGTTPNMGQLTNQRY